MITKATFETIKRKHGAYSRLYDRHHQRLCGMDCGKATKHLDAHPELLAKSLTIFDEGHWQSAANYFSVRERCVSDRTQALAARRVQSTGQESESIPNAAFALLAHFLLNHRNSCEDYQLLLQNIRKKEWKEVGREVSHTSARAALICA